MLVAKDWDVGKRQRCWSKDIALSKCREHYLGQKVQR